MSLRDSYHAHVAGLGLMWRCWRISRKYGIPFKDVFEMHVRYMGAILDEIAFSRLIADYKSLKADLCRCVDHEVWVDRSNCPVHGLRAEQTNGR